ncbi:hypothetical protein BKA70DRAFT_124523 [Coprinopsis sp. MPI-PUGE-AT-0042]|nr:hypothetical protein BKA70DRAFT_124523 [Coprinopsis sp. MPI-PUGE-AT-0042]
MQREAKFLAPTEADLEVCLRPLTLSLVPLDRLHLPSYPPLAPVWVLIPYISAHFPHLRDFKCAIAGASLARDWRPIYRQSRHEEPRWRANDMVENDVLEKTVEALVKEIRDDIESSLSPSPINRIPSSGLEAMLSPVIDHPEGPTNSVMEQLKYYKGRLLTLLKGSKGRKSQSCSKTPSLIPHPSPLPIPSEGPSTPATLPSETPKQSTTLAPPPVADPAPGNRENLPRPPSRDRPRRLRRLPPIPDITSAMSAYFGDVDPQTGIPTRKPYHASHLLYFLIKGYYRFPESIQKLDLCTCFASEVGNNLDLIHSDADRYCSSFDYGIEHSPAALSELSQRYPALSTYTISHIEGKRESRMCGSYKRIDDVEIGQGLKPKWAYNGPSFHS